MQWLQVDKIAHKELITASKADQVRNKANLSHHDSHVFSIFSTDIDAVVDEIARKEPLITASKADQVRKLCGSILYKKKGNFSYEPRCEKTCLQGFRPGPTQTGLYSHRRWLEA